MAVNSPWPAFQRHYPKLPPQPNRMKHQLLSVSEAARLRGVTRAAVYSAVARGVLPHQRMLGHIALKETDVKAWIAANVTAGRPAGTRLSKAAKERISQANKANWARRKKQAGGNCSVMEKQLR